MPNGELREMHFRSNSTPNRMTIKKAVSICFLRRQNNPEVNYSPPHGSPGGGGVFLEEAARGRQLKRDIVLGSLTAVTRELARYGSSGGGRGL